MASMADKDVDGIVDAMSAATALQDATVIATTVDAVRAMPAEALAARWLERAAPAQVIAEPDSLVALERARRQPGPTVVAGSLYLVGAVRSHLVDDPDLRDPPQP
jgi:folylpolyglutamate synthase/dihydropteroate synthase